LNTRCQGLERFYFHCVRTIKLKQMYVDCFFLMYIYYTTRSLNNIMLPLIQYIKDVFMSATLFDNRTNINTKLIIEFVLVGVAKLD